MCRTGCLLLETLPWACHNLLQGYKKQCPTRMRLDLNAQMTGEMQELVLGSWHRILPAIPAAQREPRAGWVCRRARRAWIYFWGSACLSPGAEQHQGLLWDCRDLGRNVGKLLPSECFGAVLWLDTALGLGFQRTRGGAALGDDGQDEQSKENWRFLS